MRFNELGLKEELLQSIEELGFEEAMPIQEKAIPFVLNESKDLIAMAQTGTGKTAAFGLPILQKTDTSLRQTQSLILAPTRELCVQIANDLKNFGRHLKGLNIVAVYGGENIIIQLRALDVTPQIIVATPGRLIDLMKRGKIHLEAIRHLVMDEADEMLDMGFQEDIETILASTPDMRRTLLFSATMPKEVERIAQRYMQEREQIVIGAKNSGTENVEHIYYMVQAKDRYAALKRIVDIHPEIYGIVFCRTRQETQDIASQLMRDGYNADALHGDLSQAQRDHVMNKFREKSLQLLVATDVAARGLDVNNLTHVINYNLPDDNESYNHRSGRTGRAGKKGTSIAIIHTRERGRIKAIERVIGRRFEQRRVPTGEDVCKKQLFHLIDRMEKVEVNDAQLGPLMEEVIKKTDYLSREELLRHFVALEFNRFLDYYKDARDLNVPGKKDRSESGERTKNGKSRKSGRKTQLKIDMGRNEGITPKRLLAMINEVTGDRSISVQNIDIAPHYSFFEVFEDQKDKLTHSFKQTDVSLSEVKGRRSEKRQDRNVKQTKKKEKRKKKEEKTGNAEKWYSQYEKRNGHK